VTSYGTSGVEKQGQVVGRFDGRVIKLFGFVADGETRLSESY
jgi:hypothetical protein